MNGSPLDLGIILEIQKKRPASVKPEPTPVMEKSSKEVETLL